MTTDTQTPMEPSNARKQASIGFIFVTMLIDVLGFGIVIPIMPRLIAELSHAGLGAAARHYGLLLSLYGAMQFIFAPVFGSLSDKWGRRPVLLTALFATGIDYVVMALAPALWWLFVGRAVAGITGASFTTATAYIADVTPPEKRAQSFGLVGAAFGAGFILGPAIGGLLGTLGPRVPFYGAAILSLVNWLYGLFILPESLSRENRRPFSWKSANPIGALSLLARHRMVLGLTLSFICLILGQQALQSTWVLYTTYRYNWSSAQNGLSLAAVGLMSAIVQGGLMRVIMPRLGERRALLVGIFVNIVGFVLFGLATRGWMMYPAIVIWGFSFISGPAQQGLISRQYGPTEQGAVQGALTSLNSLVGIVGPIITTAIFGYFISREAPIHLPGSAFFFGAALSVLALFLAVRTFRLAGPETILKHPEAPSGNPDTDTPVVDDEDVLMPIL